MPPQPAMAPEAPTFYAQELARRQGEMALQAEQYLLLRQSRAFIEAALGDKIQLKQMAAAAHMSRFHYLRSFQRIYGITPRQYLRQLRIQRAKALLQQGQSVTAVCLSVGYSSLPTFSRIFKQGTGHSPQKYQQLHNHNRNRG